MPSVAAADKAYTPRPYPLAKRLARDPTLPDRDTMSSSAIVIVREALSLKGSLRAQGFRVPAAALIAAVLLLLAACGARAQVASDRERLAALVPLLELQDMIYAARVARGGMTAPQADAALKAQAAAWLRDASGVTEAALVRTLRDEARLLLDHAARRIGATTRWPATMDAALARQRLEQLGQLLRDAPTTQTAVYDILVGTVEVIGWTEGRATLEPARNPFAASHERAMLAVVPAPAAASAPTKPTSAPSSVAPPSPPPGTLKLVYFGLYDDRVGPRGPNPSGKPDGRFVLSIDVGRLSSRDVTHIALQAMDANSRPVGPIWHTKDSAQSLLLVVAGDQWLNTQHVNGLATLEGPEVDLILFADNAPEPTAVNAFIVEVGFADGSIARQLAKSR